jgi:hypothetical protein
MGILGTISYPPWSNRTMASSDQPIARFRPATDFPKTIADCDRSAADAIYVEMRECLVFTNRSRGQLSRHNSDYRQNILKLKQHVEKLESLVNTLTQDKQRLAAQTSVLPELEQEIETMKAYMNQLSDAFGEVAEARDSTHTQMMPGRIWRFLQAVKAIVLWWREENSEPTTLPAITQEEITAKPQMGSDQSSIGKSLLDK